MSSLLSTKLFIPKIRPHSVRRTDLLKKLNDGISSGSHFILVSASAGYGKTTLIADWLSGLQSFSAWVSLDEGDNDPVRFFAYLLAACRKTEGGIGQEAEALLQNASPEYYTDIVTALVNDLCGLPRGISIVLDDYHVIQNPTIHKAVQILAESMPPGCLLIMLTRQDPLFPLSRYRVRNQVTEIRSSDLRFKLDESLVFFLETMQIQLDFQALELLLNRTEGWIAGLQLAAITLKNCGAENANAFIADFNGNSRYVIDYLMDEVLKHEPANRTEFLCRTAILKRFNASLCEYVTGDAQSRDILRHLEQDNLFLISLDGKREWYRYHHLFADSLKTRLEDNQKSDLFKRASQWFEANALLNEAIDYSLLAKDYENALRMIERVQGEMFDSGQLETLVRWFEHIPDEVLRTNEFLFVRKAWVYTITGRIKDALMQISSMNEACIASLSPANRGVHISLLASFADFREDEKTSLLAEQALFLIGDSEPMVRTVTLNTLASAKGRTGHVFEAIKASKEALCLGEEKLGYSFATLLALSNLVQNLILSGSRDEAESLLLKVLENLTARYEKPVPIFGIVYSNLASVLYERSALQEACSYAQKGMELLKNASLNANSTLELTYALIRAALGDQAESLEILDQLERSINPGHQSKIFRRLSSIRADMLFKMNQFDKVRQWVEEQEISVADQPSCSKETAYLTFCRLLLAENKMDEVHVLLDRLEKNALGSGRTARLITVYILFAIMHDLKSEWEESRTYIEKAVDYARKGQYYRSFLDEGGIAAELVSKYAADEPFTATLRLFFKTTRLSNFYRHDNDNHKEYKSTMSSNELPESLSARELELLELIASGLTNEEISGRLFITKNTTQWHITNIYSKLGVKNRTQAIARARSLNLIR